MTAIDRAAATALRLRRRTVGKRVQKAITAFLGEWTEDYDDQQGDDPLVATCMNSSNKVLGFYFESVTCPSFSSLLRQTGRRARIASIEAVLDQAMEIYGTNRRFVGALLDISGNFFVYTGTPEIEDTSLDFVRLSYHDGTRRFILSLDSLLEAYVEGNFL